jgi:hypothetical protein
MCDNMDMTSHACQSVCEGVHCTLTAGHADDVDHVGTGHLRLGVRAEMFWNWAADDMADTECDGCGQAVNRCQCEEE